MGLLCYVRYTGEVDSFRYSAAVLMAVVYDYDVAPGSDDHLVELLKRGSCLAMEGLTPETASLVATFPFRK